MAARATAAPRSRASRTSAAKADRCELCAFHLPPEATFRDRFRHLRVKHRSYARGVMWRLAAPGLFLAEVVIMAAIHAPQWAFLVALFSSFGLLFFGKQRSRAERRKAGARPTLPLRRLVREGGLGFLLIVPVVAIAMVLLSR